MPEPGEGSRVLIVDGSPDTTDLLVEYFTFKKWRATGMLAPQVQSDIDAGTLVGTYAPDAIIFDVAIPYDVYWNTCRAVMSDPRVHCPVIVTTTNEWALRRITCSTHPAMDIIGKPYDLERLFERVEAAVGRRTASANRSRFR